jgi:hypothetical protein
VFVEWCKRWKFEIHTAENTEEARSERGDFKLIYKSLSLGVQNIQCGMIRSRLKDHALKSSAYLRACSAVSAVWI